MGKSITVFISLLILMVKVPSFAQTYKIQNSNVLQYNKYINTAELLICDSLFHNALCDYDTAFKLLAEPFAIDKYNAAMCAFITGDYDKGSTYLEQVVKRGYNYKLLESNRIINLLDTNDRSNLFRNLEQCSVEIDYKLKNTYDSLYIIDQYFRKDSLYWITNRDTLCKTDYSNGRFMSGLIDRYGFPSERSVGVSANLLSALPWELIIIHNHVKPFCNERVDFSTAILYALEHGLIRTPKAANYLEQSKGNDIFGGGVIGLVKAEYRGIDADSSYYHVGFFIFSDNVINKINTQRTSIGLDTIEEVRKKIIFNITNTNFIFSEGLKVIYTFSTFTEFNNFVENLSILK